jgi:hypothetical protein
LTKMSTILPSSRMNTLAGRRVRLLSIHPILVANSDKHV